MQSEKEPIESALVWAVESADAIIELIDEIRASVVAVKESLEKKEDPNYSGCEMANAVSKADDLWHSVCHVSACLKESMIPPSTPKKQG